MEGLRLGALTEHPLRVALRVVVAQFRPLWKKILRSGVQAFY